MAESGSGAAEVNALFKLSATSSGKQAPVFESSTNFEADIPDIGSVPTLESILNDENTATPTIHELGLTELVNDESVGSLPSFSSVPEIHELQDRTKSETILHQSILEAIANQLSRANVRNTAGLPTAMTAGSCYAIGTSRGLVLVFDENEQLKCVLSPVPGTNKSGEHVDAGQHGSVSCLDINNDGSRLLVGHSKGLITNWDLTTNRLLRFIDDAHPPGFAVLNIRFTDDPAVILFSDSGGNVYFLRFTRNVLGVRNWHSECFFSGCNGEALTFEPVRLESIPNHPLKNYCVIAIATVTQVMIIGIAPKLEGLLSLALKGNPTTLPLLAWQFVIIEEKKHNKTRSTVHPVLAAVRENHIYYIKMDSVADVPSFQLIRDVTVDYTITAFKWINAQTVVAMDSKERVHLLSVRDNMEIEVLDLMQMELVYSSSFYKSIETGGNVSQALVAASDRACYNSIVASQNQLLLLGLNAVYKVTIKSWVERLACLVRDGHFVKAINLGLKLYEGKAKAVVGLSGSQKKKKEVISKQVVDILQGFVDIKLLVNKPTSVQEKDLRGYYKGVAQIAFDCCLRIKKEELLFGSLYETFSGEGNLCRDMFLEVLQVHIMERRVKRVSPVISKGLLDHYAQLGEYSVIQQLVLSLDPACLDIHRVVEMCWSHRLYDAMIYVYNSGLRDYITPLLELLLLLRNAMKKGKSLTEHYQKVGYKLLVYIRCCLSGMAYPSGNIAPDMVLFAKTSVYETLLTPANTHDPTDKDKYPHIRTLLDFDTREFLNVLAFAFEEKDFDLVEAGEHLPGIPKRQTVVDILLDVTLRDQKTSSAVKPSQVGSLFTFIARQGGKHSASITVDDEIYDQVLSYITKADEDVVNEERQQAVLELWHAGVLKRFKEERLLIMAESARFYRLCELLYEKRRQFGKVLSCYLRDPQRRHQSFSYIHHLMSDDEYTEPDREECTRAVLEHCNVLLRTDIKATARLILLDFPLEVAEVTYKLQSNPELQFHFLQGIFDPNISSKQEIQPPSHIVERYIELLCLYAPQDVYPFLSLEDNYSLDNALDICALANILDATAYLLERTGDVKGAYKLILDALRTDLIALGDSYARDQMVSDAFAASKKKAQGVLVALLQLCQRNSNQPEEKAYHAMWLSVFELVLAMLNRYKASTNPHLLEAFKSMVTDVLNCMMGYIKLTDILQKIVEDPAYESGQFKDIKQIILGMLETCNYEETLLVTTNQIVVRDVQSSLTNLCSLAHKGMRSTADRCSLCDRSVTQLGQEGSGSNTGAPAGWTNEDVVMFSCSHLYHSACLGVSGVSPSLGATCLLCDKTTKPAYAHQSRLNATSWTDAKSDLAGQKRTNKREEVHLDEGQLRRLRMLNSSRITVDEMPELGLRLAPPKLET